VKKLSFFASFFLLSKRARIYRPGSVTCKGGIPLTPKKALLLQKLD